MEKLIEEIVVGAGSKSFKIIQHKLSPYIHIGPNYRTQPIYDHPEMLTIEMESQSRSWEIQLPGLHSYIERYRMECFKNRGDIYWETRCIASYEGLIIEA